MSVIASFKRHVPLVAVHHPALTVQHEPFGRDRRADEMEKMAAAALNFLNEARVVPGW